jgi:hypothetical protein
MSYKSAIIYDQPVAYYPLDDATTADSLSSFTDLLSQYDDYQDVLNSFSTYAEIYGDIAHDYSGLQNDGNYVGDPAPSIITLVAGNTRSSLVTNTNAIVYKLENDYIGGA